MRARWSLGAGLSVANLDALKRVFGIDTRSLALFRVGLAVLVIVDVLTRFPDLVAHYTDAGVLPRDAVGLFQDPQWHFSLYFLHGGLALPATLFVLTLVCGLMLLVGYRSRVAVIALWFLVMCLQARNPVVLNRGDETLRVLLFWSMFLPLGLRWSVDRALASNAARLPRLVLSFGSAGMLVQVASIYLFTWLLKTGAAWRDGTAVEMALRLDRLATPLAEYLLAAPALLPVLTHSVFWFELLGALLLFSPIGTARVRMLLVLAFALMHVGFAAFLGIGMFPLFSLLALVPFVPSAAWDAWKALNRGGEGWVIYYDGGCSFCRKMTLLLETFLVLPRVTVREAQSDPAIEAVMLEQNTWVVVDPDGVRHTHSAGLRAVVRASPLFSPLRHLWRLPLFAALVDRAYRWVAGNRPTASRAATVLRFRALPERAPGAVQVAAGAALFYVLAWNVTGVVNWLPPAPAVAHALQVQQRWSMFSPQPPSETGWFVMTGRLSDGRTLDLLAGLRGRVGVEASDVRPERYPSAFPNYRWNRYTSKMTATGSPLGAPFAEYLCRLAGRGQGSGLVEGVSIVFMHYAPQYPEVAPRARLINETSCVPGPWLRSDRPRSLWLEDDDGLDALVRGGGVSEEPPRG